MSSAVSISAIILAAGSSSRMGSQKQLLRLGSKTLLEHTLESVRASQVREIVVVLGSAAEAVRPHIPSDEIVRVVVNDGFQAGMGSSLQRGLAELSSQAGATLVVLADQPLVKPATLNRLISDYLEHKSQILIPLYRGFRGNPVLLDRSVFPEIAALHGDTGGRAIFGDHLDNIRKIEVNDAGVLLDADRPQDLHLLRKIYESDSFDLPEMETAASDLAPAPELVLVGREGVAVALAKFAHLLDFRVAVVDPLLTFADTPEATTILRVMDFARLPVANQRFCVVASMGRFDEEGIEQAIAAAIPYIALVANKKRSQEVLHSLSLKGLRAEQIAHVRTKPGISIGAQTSAEIALSVIAEIVEQVRRA
jgi:molybdenum cofactor cytidylyltransferase